jgi:hypothetical protein
MIKVKFEGYEIVGTGHDISKNDWKLLSNTDINFGNISEVVNNYDPWSTNYFQVSGPLIDENLIIKVFDKNNNSLWEGNCDALCDIYQHAEKFPEIAKIHEWDEPNQKGDAVAWEEHPYILYYEELNQGTVGICNIGHNEFEPNNLSIVEGCLETDEVEWVYINKIYYMGKPLKLEPLDHELKNKYEKLKLIK